MGQQKIKRKILIVDRKFQMRYVFILLSIMLLSVLAVSFTTFYVIWSNVIDELFFVAEVQHKLTDIFVKTTYTLIPPILILSAVFSFVGIMFSHKIAGPIYRVKRVAEDVSKGKLDVSVKFRKGDEMHDLAESLNEMIAGVRSIVTEDKKMIGKINKISVKLQSDVKKQKGLKQDVKDTIVELNKIVRELRKSTKRFKV